MANVRKTAYTVLMKIENDGAYSAPAIDSAAKSSELDARDTAFLSNLVYGVLERKLLLDEIISQYSSIPISKIACRALMILRIGLYQLLFMDRVPDSAAVNESVKLSKKLGLYSVSGFINAVLRSFLRNGKKYTLPDKSDIIKYLSVQYSCPEDIVKTLVSDYGEELAEKILNSYYEKPPVTVRVNTLKTDKTSLVDSLRAQNITVEENRFLENTLHLYHTGALESLDEFKNGLFYVQDLSSQLACEVFDARSGETICDVCSAPGGKSFYCSVKMNDKGAVYSYDIYDHKIRMIEESSERLGISIIRAGIRDASDSSLKLPDCDKILCDVPCSGLGVIRRKPEIRYKKETNIDKLVKLQYSILCVSVEALPIGGEVMYSTCTLTKAENSEIVEKFLRGHKDFEPVALHLPDGFERILDEPDHMLTVLPGMYSSDGFFFAKMRRRAADD